jgi:integrase
MGKLTALQVKNAKPGGRLGDGDGLWLFVDRNGNGSWILRFVSPLTGKQRELGLGPLRDVALAAARVAAGEARSVVRQGVDPIEQRRAARETVRQTERREVTFKAYAEGYIAAREAGWKNPKHRQQWHNSLRDHAYPTIGHFAVGDVDTECVLDVLRPIWSSVPETARRVRGRVEMILSAAKAEGLRSGENPALWRGHLDQVLARRKKSSVQHHSALPYDEMPKFWQSLATDTSNAANMLRFVILTACRFNEAAQMQPTEISGDIWTIPAPRMKAERAHQVPLTPLALGCLPFAVVSDVSLAKCIKRHTDSPATTHGFRSTFRDWAGDCTEFAREVAEAALAHAVGDETEAAYRRSTALAKRRTLMEEWSQFCSG